MKPSTALSLCRPFTLLPPLLGILSGSACAWGSAHNPHSSFSLSLLFWLVLGSFCASLMNAASNIINQVYDLDIDRHNKPGRPIPRGEVSEKAAMILSYILYFFAIVPVWWVVPPPHDGSLMERTFAPLPYHACFFIFFAGLALTFIYSAPALGRTKRNGFAANFTIALARGELLKVAGWAMIANVMVFEPWYLGLIFFLFLMGATSTKDFSDMEGDRRFGCITLPVKYGAEKAARMIAPFFVFPWALLPIGLIIKTADGKPLLTGNPALLIALSAILTAWGIYTVRLILRDPKALTTTENHPSWKHMYLMMMFAQIGLGLAYLI